MLSGWLSARFRLLARQKNAKSPSRARAATDPITMPAMAPPESPLLADAAAAAVVVAVDVIKVTEDVMLGKETFAQRLSASEL